MTKSVIYYFSGTGNSFVVAKELSIALDAKLIAIKQLNDTDSITSNASCLGFVFPDYHSDVPLIMKNFIDRFEQLHDAFIFAVCTYGGKGPGATLLRLKDLIRQKDGFLHCGFAVHMPYNYILPNISLKPFRLTIGLKEYSDQQIKEILKDWENNKASIIDYIRQRKTGRYDSSGRIILKIFDMLKLHESIGKRVWLRFAGLKNETHRSFDKSRKVMDKAFVVLDQCIHCKTCVRICPVHNINWVKDKPVFLHQCEQCFACLQFCVVEAIQFKKNTIGQKRYHHPRVTADDLI